MSKKNSKRTKTVSISVSAPEYRGAPYPEFDEMCINESCFDDELRAKEWHACIENGVGHVKWLSQEGEDPTDSWESEVKRAFKANGLKKGAFIEVTFGSRDVGYIHEYELYV